MIDQIISKLIDLTIKRWSDQQQPRAQTARAFAQLHSSLTQCHKAFTEYQNDPSPFLHRRWGLAIDSFTATLGDSDATLSIFDEQLTNGLRHYIVSERRLYSDPESLAEISIQELVQISYEIGLPSPGTSLKKSGIDLSDFEEAGSRLAEFIRTNFSLEEIYGSLTTA